MYEITKLKPSDEVGYAEILQISINNEFSTFYRKKNKSYTAS